MLDPEVVVAPGLVFGVVLRVVLVASCLQGSVEMLGITLIQVISERKKKE